MIFFYIYSARIYSSRITIRETSSATSWKQMNRPIAKHQVKLGEPSRRQEEGLQEPEDSRTPQEHCPQHQLGRAQRGSQRLKQQLLSLPGSALGPLLTCCGDLAWDFVELVTVVVCVGGSLILLPALETLILLLGCLIQT